MGYLCYLARKHMGLLNLAKPKPLPFRSPIHAQVPELQRAELAAAYYGERMGGDFYDFIRVNPRQVLFGLLDVAGRLEENHDVVNAAQRTFRTVGAELFSKKDSNDSESMIELCLQLNRTILESSDRVHSCPAFAG